MTSCSNHIFLESTSAEAPFPLVSGNRPTYTRYIGEWKMIAGLNVLYLATEPVTFY